jgi:glycosyltransferase involved in cell wall biosynthesis
MPQRAAATRLFLPATAIVMPAFNEAESIGAVLGEIRRVCDLPVLVVDDASTDDTVARAEAAGATVIPLPSRLGAWGATQTGLRYALRHDFERVITMDADGQHDAQCLPELVRPVAAGEVDVAIGACTRRGSTLRRIAWVMMKRVSGLSLEDITSGLRAYNRRALIELAGWRATLLEYQDIGVLLLLQSRGLRIADVEVAMRPRLAGSSRVFRSWLLVAYYMSHSLLLGLTKRKLPRLPRGAAAG